MLKITASRVALMRPSCKHALASLQGSFAIFASGNTFDTTSLAASCPGLSWSNTKTTSLNNALISFNWRAISLTALLAPLLILTTAYSKDSYSVPLFICFNIFLNACASSSPSVIYRVFAPERFARSQP